MAYAAVICLRKTIEGLPHSPLISSLPPFSTESAYKEVKLLEYFLQNPLFTSVNSERVNALERQIRETVRRLADVLESYSLDQFLSPSETTKGDQISYPLTLSRDLALEVKEEIDFFVRKVKLIRAQLSDLLLLEEDDVAVSSRTDDVDVIRDRKKSKILGFDDELIKLKNLLAKDTCDFEVVSIFGMAGIGKTTLANEVYIDPLIQQYFDCSAFVPIGQKYEEREILLGILAQMDCGIDRKHAKTNEELGKYLYRSLEDMRYLIVLDDIWNAKFWFELKRFFPKNKKGSRIVITTRLETVAFYATNSRKYLHRMRFLSEEESWHLLRETVFAEERSCPPQLENAGKKIAEKCEGLPLAIIEVGKQLSKAERTQEYWDEVALAEKDNSVFNPANEEISKVLYSSYKHLPYHLKVCFLYMGIFPHNLEISASKLTQLWCAEGFLQQNWPSKDFARRCLEELVFNNVVLARQQGSRSKIKTCRVHFVFRYLCIREARKNKFFLVIDHYANQGIESQSRLCIHNNGLFGIKDVYKSMASSSNACSLLCVGPHHQYPVPVCLGFSLLRILDALTIRFYGFPIEVEKLVQLRYLAFTYNGKLPASISKLQSLQYLIVHQYLNILPFGGSRPYLPLDIWTMQELKHLQVMGSDLPDPNSEGARLPNLSTLLGISAQSCTQEVLGRIPNLKKLGIQMELSVDAVESMSCFDHLTNLRRLESLKCVIVNPNPKLPVVVPAPPTSIFPSRLKKLTLSGLGFPWEYMSTIAELRNLEVLKLRCHAFRGPMWNAYGCRFLQLKFLLLEDIDLEYWYRGRFPWLERLIIRDCYKLKRIPLGIKKISSLEMIELVDCNPSLISLAKRIVEEQKSTGDDYLQICIKSSADDRTLRS
ncbi:putative disease resistance RPP13-like protein 2 [Sesamum alatum]|uniref:Disease resistance RPP13-like protein 2 n=1 Tax=Sesamum alatum TaxID=300844 RepID=A0AAE2CLX1_9LAMI|nr:putative disease resistance RPP13-like protein 2 [Sesamum alatum]